MGLQNSPSVMPLNSQLYQILGSFALSCVSSSGNLPASSSTAVQKLSLRAQAGQLQYFVYLYLVYSIWYICILYNRILYIYIWYIRILYICIWYIRIWYIFPTLGNCCSLFLLFAVLKIVFICCLFPWESKDSSCYSIQIKVSLLMGVLISFTFDVAIV